MSANMYSRSTDKHNIIHSKHHKYIARGQRPESIYKELRETCLKQYSENNSLLNVLK